MIIRKYGELPLTFAPDVGEIVMARRTALDPFTRAVVVVVRRRRDGALRMRLVWLEDNPATGLDAPSVKANTDGWVTTRIGARPELIRQISKDQAPSA